LILLAELFYKTKIMGCKLFQPRSWFNPEVHAHNLISN